MTLRNAGGRELECAVGGGERGREAENRNRKRQKKREIQSEI